MNLRVDEVRLAPDGRPARREVVEHPGAVAVVPLTPDCQVVMVRQYRYAVGEELLEIPAGTMQAGEEPEACARRELGEETGGRARSLELLGTIFTSPGFCSEVMHIFLARLEDGPGGQPQPDEDERLEPVTLPLGEVVELARAGRLRDAKTVAGLLLAAARVGVG